MLTALDIVTGALREINAIAQGEQPDPGDAEFGLEKLNRLTDQWSARKPFIFDVSLPVYTLVPSLSPHTIGPMGQLTSSSLANNVATYVQQNRYVNGDNVTVFNSTNGLNTTGRVQLATAAKFSIAYVHADVANAPDVGNSLIAGTTPPTFATPNSGPRPQRVEQCNLILNNSNPTTDVPMNVRDAAWWMNQRVKNITTSVPTDVYYDPNFPNGSLYFWPVPDTAYQVRLKLWGVLPQFPALSYPVTLPPGYENALTMSLARNCVGSFQGSWSPNQESEWRDAIKAVQSNNIKSPRGFTIDAGMPRNNNRADFNWETGMPSSS